MTEHHRARKRFGQHFLADDSILQQMTRLIAPDANQQVLEIGPGQGVLSQYIAPRVAKFDVVELDRDLIPGLQRLFSGQDHVTIHQADALKFSLRSLFDLGSPQRLGENTSARKIRVIGNLPYNISTPLLFHLFEEIELIEDMHFLLQKEVVDRICAKPNSSSYGRLSVMTQFYCHSSSLLQVPPQAFKPPPKVDSAVVRMIPHAQAPIAVNNVLAFSAFVAQAFSARRKTLRNVFKTSLSQADFESAQIDSQRRAETLSLAEFGRLYHCSEAANPG